MTDKLDANEIFAALDEAHRILDEPQFMVPDVVVVTGATAKAIEHMIDPKKERVRLDGHHISPGTGRRRMFTGLDVLKLTTAFTMSQIGFPQRWSIMLTEEIGRRASNRITGLVGRNNLMIATYPLKTGDWAYVPLYSDDEQKQALPLAVQLLDADRLIDETLAKLQAIVAEKEVPDFSIPDPVPEPSPYSPENDFFRMWEKDSEGRDVFVGLSFEETQERNRLMDLWLADRSLAPDSNQILLSKEDQKKLRELDKRHEMARYNRDYPDMMEDDDEQD
jgi:hypothetical protein